MGEAVEKKREELRRKRLPLLRDKVYRAEERRGVRTWRGRRGTGEEVGPILYG